MNNLNTKGWQLLSSRQRMSPFPNYMSMVATCKYAKKFFGFNLDEIILFWQDRLMIGFVDGKDSEKKGKALVEVIKKDHKFFAQLIKLQTKYGQELLAFSKKTNQQITGKTTNKQLLNFYKTYEKKYYLVYASYCFVWVVEDLFMSELLSIIQKEIKDVKKSTDILNILTQQPSAMVAGIENRAFMKLAIDISKNKIWKKLVLEKNIEKVKSINLLKKIIIKHVDKYFWVTRDYEDDVLTIESTIERLCEILKTKNLTSSYKKEIEKLQNFETNRNKYINKLKLNKYEIALFESMRDMAHLKELRKRYVSESLYYFDKVLIEIGKRLFMSIKQVRFMTTDDLKKFLIDGQDISEEINQRMKQSVWYFSGMKMDIIIGKKAENLFNKFNKPAKNLKEFTGMAVSPGIAKGPVKIVMNPDELDKVKKGDIIVSVQVVPSFSTAIIKSAGIICDGGHGATSHPATLAREAGIPCVIQTRFAREILKDGDIVEVDGYKGVARLIKKK